MWASLVCAVHCARLPLVLALLPMLGLGALDLVDIDQVRVSDRAGRDHAGVGYRRHRAFGPGLCCRVALVWANSFTALHDHSAWHAVMMVGGGLMIAAAHFLNFRLSHRVALPSGAA